MVDAHASGSPPNVASAANGIGWPQLPQVEVGDPQAEVKKVLYQAQVQIALTRQQLAVDEKKMQDAEDIDSRKAGWAYDYAVREVLHNAYVDVIKGAIDRSQSRAQYIQTAAAAISTAYAAILALSFKADGTAAHPLPARGIVPTFFLGLAIAFSAIYLSYIGRGSSVPGPSAGASLIENEERRLETFVAWASLPILARIYFLQAAVISLAVGIALLPIVYTHFTGSS